jgi:formylglycine-generating enzyme required for sulfatase activity
MMNIELALGADRPAGLLAGDRGGFQRALAAGGTRMLGHACTLGLALVLGLAEFTAIPALAHGDYDGDHDVDNIDFGACAVCWAGPEAGLGSGCGSLDFDWDNDVDLSDFTAFQQFFGAASMTSVPGGTFQMGDPWSEGNANEIPVHAVYVSSFYLDTYEVTNQQYADALNWAYAQGGLITVASDSVYQYGTGNYFPYCTTSTSTSPSRITWDGDTFGVVSGWEHHPMTRLSWYGAVAYCNWRSAMRRAPLCYDLSTWACIFGVAGYRLPTEAEWEKAAGWDPAQQRHFRFGEHTDGCGRNCLEGARANFWNSGDPFETDPISCAAPVGYYDGTTHDGYATQNAPSYYGCFDMSGNVLEWCHDWYSNTYYANSPASDPTGPPTGADRTLRGGGWGSTPDLCRTARRFVLAPNVYYQAEAGVRCALGTP